MSNFDFSTLIILAFSVSIISLLTILWRKNLLIILMGLELSFLVTSMLLVGASYCNPSQTAGDGPLMVLFILVMAACEAAIAISLILQIYKRYGSIWVDDIANDD